MMIESKLTRRPLTSRDTRWAAAAARWLATIGLRPNQISVLGLLCGSLAAAAFVGAGMHDDAPRIMLLVAAAAFIQLRLLCNLLDGMVAVEGGFKTKSGEVYNELPDRLADAMILTGAGFALPASEWMHSLGWLAALLALITAYVRALGASAGASQSFLGPMAKPHRMALMTVAALTTALAFMCGSPMDLIHPALGLVILGCLVTVARRVRRIILELESR